MSEITTEGRTKEQDETARVEKLEQLIKDAVAVVENMLDAIMAKYPDEARELQTLYVRTVYYQKPESPRDLRELIHIGKLMQRVVQRIDSQTKGLHNPLELGAKWELALVECTEYLNALDKAKSIKSKKRKYT